MKNSKGFTLIELLLVIAVLGVLAAAVLTAINPIAKINAAKDATMKSDISQLANAISAYYINAAARGAVTYPVTLSDLIPSELKTTPKQQSGTSGCIDLSGNHGAGGQYCYNGTSTTAVLWAPLFSDTTKIYCWDSGIGTFKTTTIPSSNNIFACP